MSDQRATPSGSTTQETYYRWRDAQGREHITNDAERAPESAERSTATVVADRPSQQLDAVSFLLGAALGAVTLLVLGPFLRAHRRWLGVALVVVAACLGAAAYLGWIRRTAGFGTGTFAGPQTLVDDARRAVDKANAAGREHDEEIRRAQKEAR